MKIAIVVGIFPKISETFILNQITGLIDLGHHVDIFAFEKSNEKKIHSDIMKYNLLSKVTYLNEVSADRARRISKSLKIILRYFLFCPKEIINCLNYKKYGGIYYALNNLFKIEPFLRKKYSIIHCHFGPIGLFGAFLKKIGISGKYVTSFHGYDVNGFPEKNGKDCYHSLFKDGDIFIANTNFTKQQMINLGCNAKRIVVLPVGLRKEKFKFSTRRIQPGETIKILTVGRLVEKKGYEYSIKAIARVSTYYKNVIYIIVGDGPLRNKLGTLVSELEEMKFRVQFLGAMDQDDILKYYEQAHIFVLASVTANNGDKEGQGLVLQEAQAVGLPVISTLHNGIPEGVLDGESGFLVPEKDTEALGERIKYLIENPEIWQQMGLTGRKFVEENFDIRKLNKRLVEIYKNGN